MKHMLHICCICSILRTRQGGDGRARPISLGKEGDFHVERLGQWAEWRGRAHVYAWCKRSSVFRCFRSRNFFQRIGLYSSRLKTFKAFWVFRDTWSLHVSCFFMFQPSTWSRGKLTCQGSQHCGPAKLRQRTPLVSGKWWKCKLVINWEILGDGIQMFHVGSMLCGPFQLSIYGRLYHPWLL